MKSAVAPLLLSGIALASLLNVELTSNRQPREQIDRLTLRLSDQLESFELQARCAERAKRMFRALAFDNASYYSHYNAKLNRCLMAVDVALLAPLRITRSLYDAHEKKMYATF